MAAAALMLLQQLLQHIDGTEGVGVGRGRVQAYSGFGKAFPFRLQALGLFLHSYV